MWRRCAEVILRDDPPDGSSRSRGFVEVAGWRCRGVAHATASARAWRGRTLGLTRDENAAVTEDPFQACWLRVERADEHQHALVEIWNDFIEEHPFDFSLDHQGDGVHILRVWQDEPTPPELGVVTGEWLYNMRCALDYIVWAAAVYHSGRLPPPDEGVLQYPIYDHRDAWERNQYRLRGLPQHQRDMLESVQPYNSSDPEANYLGWINRLARIDRHRRLSVVTAYMAEVEPVIEIPKGCTTTLEFGERVLVDGQADISRITVSPWRDGMSVRVNPRAGIDPELADWAESPFWRRIRFTERFTMLRVFVRAEVAVYEYDCTGSSRMAHVLADDWKAESDARRQYLPIRVVHADAPSWGLPTTGRPSTRQRFEGRDFPPHGPGDAD